MEIIPKPPTQVPTLKRILSLVSLIFLFFVIFLFLLFLFLIKDLNSKKASLEKTISELETPQVKEMKEEASQLSEQLSEIENLLSSHLFPSRFFPFLESKILKKVTLTSLDLNPFGNTVKISGIAEDFPTVAKQFLFLLQSPEIENLEINSVSITEKGKVNFEFTFSFKGEIIK